MNYDQSTSIILLVAFVAIIAACVPSPTPAVPTSTPMPSSAPTPTIVPTLALATATVAAVKLPRTIVLDPKVLTETKAKLAAGDKTLDSAFKKLIQDADAALKFKPPSVMDKPQVADSGDKHDYLSLARYYWPDPSKANGLPYISRDGEVSPEIDSIPDKKGLGNVINTTATLGLAFYFTGEEKYAEKSAEILRVWFLNPETRMNPNGNYAQVQKGRGIPGGTGIIDFVALGTIVDNVGLLEESKSWTDEDRQGMHAWIGDFLAWLTTSKPGQNEAAATNNHSTWYDTQVIAHMLFTGKNDAAKKRLEAVKSDRIAKQIEPNGAQPRELARTLSLHYSVYNLEAFFRVAELGARVGVDLWNYQTPDGRSIRKALDFMFPYIAGEEKWTYQQISPFDSGEVYPLLLRASIVYNDKKFWDLGLKVATGDLKTSRLNLTLTPPPSQP